MQTLIHDKILGILGLGRIGSQVARIAQAFGMKVIAWGPTLTEQRALHHGVELVSLPELFKRSDIVSIHLRLSDQTKNIIGHNEIKLMKQTALLVNTARGKIIDENALIDALKSKIIAGACLDVFSDEPIDPDHPFLKMSNVLLTPHIGFVTFEGLGKYFEDAVINILNYLSGKPSNLVVKT
jgi:phosphoglycerate dehydrogenase-like enzyme